jgi:serine beta-lactamase-like protein LACTB
MAKKKAGMWLALGIVVIGAVASAISVMVFVNNFRPPIHPNPKDISSVARSQPLPKWAAAANEARELIRTHITQQNLLGMSVAVGIGGDIVWAEGFGWANLENRQPVTPETRHRIGHVSKALTSVGVGLLRDQGRLHLNDEIQKYVPAFPEKQWPITVRQLMGHVAGIHHYRDTEWGDKPSAHCERASEGLRSFANDPQLFEPETQYRYSTYGWVLVSAAVESVAGEPFFDFMRAKVFEPLGMIHTASEAASKSSPDRATSYFRGNFGQEITTNVDYSCFAGAGAFVSTPSDLVRFGLAMMDGKLLQPTTLSMLQTSQQLTTGADTAYGLGWMLETNELLGQPARVAGHASRTIEGASTSFLTFPERGIAVAVSSNMSFADMRSIAFSLAEAFAKAEKK